MIVVTPSAIDKLQALIAEHPEDPIVRIELKELGDNRRIFRITLDSAPQPDDQVQKLEGLNIAIDGKSADRMEGVTLDYLEPDGFKFHHPPVSHEYPEHPGDPGDNDDGIDPLSLN
jgi:Fe-S cluster assembly iron-binding protein IscA